MDDTMKLTEQDFNDLIEAVGLWANESPDTTDATSAILANVLSDQNHEKIEHINKREENRVSAEKKAA